MKKPDQIEFHYRKSPYFKSFYSNGIYGGISPSGLISMAFFIERPPIPQKAVYEVKDEDVIGKELPEQRVSKEGIIREVDCNILLDLTTAKVLRDWLDNNIKNLEELTKKQKS